MEPRKPLKRGKLRRGKDGGEKIRRRVTRIIRMGFPACLEMGAPGVETALRNEMARIFGNQMDGVAIGLFVALMVYVLSLAPAVKYAGLLQVPVPGEAWNATYWPVVWMGMHSYRFQYYMNWYCVHVWQSDDEGLKRGEAEGRGGGKII